MLLIGTMEWAKTKLTGEFRCPTCEEPSKFRLRDSRPFLTLYFIPVLPIGGRHEFVECRSCKDAFEPAVLSVSMIAPPQERAAFASSEDKTAERLINTAIAAGNNQEVEFAEDLLAAIALCCIEDGRVSEVEIATARRVYAAVTSRPLARKQLAQACSEAQVSGLSTGTFFTTAALRRSSNEAVILVQSIFLVASSEGNITPKRLGGILRSFGEIGLSEEAFREAIADAPKLLGGERIGV